MAHYEVWKDLRGEFRIRCIADNGEIVSSGESYRRKADCFRAIKILQSTRRIVDRTAPEAPKPRAGTILEGLPIANPAPGGLLGPLGRPQGLLGGGLGTGLLGSARNSILAELLKARKPKTIFD